MSTHLHFVSSGAYRHASGSTRSGRPSLHWAEMAMSEAYIRIRHQDTAMAPGLVRIHDSYWTVPSIRTVKTVHNSEHIPRMDNTKLFRVINTRAQDRLLWNALLTKPRKADTS